MDRSAATIPIAANQARKSGLMTSRKSGLMTSELLHLNLESLSFRDDHQCVS